MESCPTQAVLPLVGLAADQVIRDRYVSGGWQRFVLRSTTNHTAGVGHVREDAQPGGDRSVRARSLLPESGMTKIERRRDVMPKYYVESGPVKLVLEAKHAQEAAVKAFQWSCDQQATIQTDCPLEHVRLAERRGWQLHETVWVNERGFDQADGQVFDTLDVLVAWQEGLNGSRLRPETGRRGKNSLESFLG
ncbi:MAG: hypothetical protein ACQESR_27310 [Planctomycetota bacterium]